MKTKIYQNEINDGLSVYFEKPLSIAYEIPIVLSASTDNEYAGKVKSVANVVGKLNEDDFLYEFPSILVTAGVWNKNDQVFDKYEVWKARYTPLNKPSNLNHKPDQVVAHASKVFPITDEAEAKLIPDVIDGKPNDNIPDVYHLLTVDNLYKYNIKAYQAVNKEYSEKIQAVYEKVVTGELSVSMECIFADFDYAIMDKDGKQSVIVRDEKTSFLSKKLKRFKGTGEFQGYRIGMLMRDIVFTGKGITDNPANKSSIIFSKDCLAFASQNYTKSEDIFNPEKDSAYITSDNGEQKMTLEQAQARITELEAKLADAAKNETVLESTKVELAEVKSKLEVASAKIVEVEKTAKEKADALEVASKEVTDSKEKLASAETKVSELNAQITKTDRVAKIQKVLGLDEVESEKTYVVVATLNDVAFANYLDNTKKLVEKNSSKTVEEKQKTVDELNAKLAAEQLATAEAEKAKQLGTASDTAEGANVKLLNSVKSVFKKQ
jgi:hypothetical protein